MSLVRCWSPKLFMARSWHGWHLCGPAALLQTVVWMDPVIWIDLMIWSGISFHREVFTLQTYPGASSGGSPTAPPFWHGLRPDTSLAGDRWSNPTAEPGEQGHPKRWKKVLLFPSFIRSDRLEDQLLYTVYLYINIDYIIYIWLHMCECVQSLQVLVADSASSRRHLLLAWVTWAGAKHWNGTAWCDAWWTGWQTVEIQWEVVDCDSFAFLPSSNVSRLPPVK